jgi:hypothetical protein
MSKAKVNPAMEGNVSRAVDFNLKKEDLMLLILEGRKENMEVEIGNIQAKSTQLEDDINKAKEAFRKKMYSLCSKTMNAEAKRIAKMFSDKELGDIEEDDDEEVQLDGFKLSLGTYGENFEYVHHVSKPIGDGKGSTYIKQTTRKSYNYVMYSSMTLKLTISLQGKTFVNKNPIFKSEEIRAAGGYGQDFEIANERLDDKFQKELPEYKKMISLIEAYGANETLLSDILAEYDLFNRNQPRAKAKMIKEVLSRDESGQALLENIMTAASGVKLLA